MGKRILMSLTILFIVSSLKAQQVNFGEMTTLEQFGGNTKSSYIPTKEESQRIEWWKDAKFGMFMHWGLYSQIAGYWKNQKIKGGEWCLKMSKLPIEEYRNLANYFNPEKFDADQWVALIKAAGMKYLVITSKHHDGFAMYHSKVSKYNIVDATPFKRDPLKELAEACRRQGIKFGLYYSHAQDWDDPDGYGNNWSWPDHNRNFDKYLDEKSIPQIKEILTQYQPDILWFDTAGDITEERAYEIMHLCRSICPNILINSRIMRGQPKGEPVSDYDSGGDNEGFKEYHDRPWELCGTLNRSWAFKQWDTDFRPVEELISKLIDAVSKNGNYLLNVGPTCEGEITESYSNRLLEIGKWLNVNGEAIYGCEGLRWNTDEDWRCTTKDKNLYVHVLNYPMDGEINLPSLDAKTAKASILGFEKEKVKLNQTTEGINIKLPKESPSSLPIVVKITTK